ncbi:MULTISPECIES: EndoU domain-containing protein [Cyanophyceae]|uniref:EndoU domain-containing protein n=1 Tax=Cyanophyceae TaxID=3028117 RepID=UPI00232EB0D6|nr:MULTISPECIES: EndoU domain-containing protein [Cyanophyceae]MDB9357341.1 EndoU domain-containing protein [Nodularia spumigena CS-587/03]MDB9341179.1 EndoU domain-containing protein [Nodularia spumigena CS-589/07]MDB9402369.1 EndoU domain-containing protein [Microcystis aeruginosa CS-567/02-A1]MDB9499365.1 EndoU domain-containing protein [Nodularia spumigena CS-336/02]MDB9532417.1 EndoU domain-containing protein [Nodularia spumigena CS-1038]
MNRQQVTRNNQQSKNETPLVSGILQRSAVHSPEEESSYYSESRFHQDFSQVPITNTAQIIQAKSTVSEKNIGILQMRSASSRGANRRTYVLPQAVKDHIFVNQNNGVGFHSIARVPNNLINHVQQIDHRNRNLEAYTANHLNNAGQVIQAGMNKSMFPDGWNENKVIDVIERAFTLPSIINAQQTQINQQGATAQNNRPLPAAVNGRIRGRADGIRIEGIMGNGSLQTAYPLI